MAYSHWNRSCACIAAVSASAFSCSGRSSLAAPSDSDGGPSSNCDPGENPRSSDEAIAYARRCSGFVPWPAAVAVINDSSLSVEGTAWSWTVLLLREGDETTYMGVIAKTGITITSAGTAWKGLHCATPVNDSVSSKVLVPDALRRLSARGISATRAYFGQTGECGTTLAGNRVVVTSELVKEGTTTKEHWLVLYDWSGVFRSVCGPCKTMDSSQCAACSTD